MSLEEEFTTILKAEGYPSNEVILDAMKEFIGIIEDEAEGMEIEDFDDDDA